MPGTPMTRKEGREWWAEPVGAMKPGDWLDPGSQETAHFLVREFDLVAKYIDGKLKVAKKSLDELT